MEETKEPNKKVEDLLKVTHEELIETYKSFHVNKTNLQKHLILASAHNATHA